MQAARGASLKAEPRSRAVLAISIALAGLVVDQATKVLAVDRLTGEAPRELIGQVLRLNLVYNPGAAFGLGGRFTIAISILAVVATVVATWFAARSRSVLWAVALGLIIAGVGGNLVDRLFREPGPLRGHVVDFLQLPNWPVFNIADVCINAGAALIVIQFVRGVEVDGSRTGADEA